MQHLKSSVVAQELGIPYSHLVSLLRSGKLTPPKKDSSGDFVWSSEDLQAARQAMAIDRRRRNQEVSATGNQNGG